MEGASNKIQTDQQKKASIRCLQWTIAYGILLALFIYSIYNMMISCPEYLNNRTLGTLRSCVSTELAFQGSTEDHHYGSFDELRNTLYIPEGYTQGNMIEQYSITWETSNISTAVSEDYPFGLIGSFTIVAWPVPYPNRHTKCLMTFAITEDQIVRVYNPDNENDLSSVKSWDPIF
jgi:hypothetical protein